MPITDSGLLSVPRAARPAFLPNPIVRRIMSQLSFTPPTRDPGIDILQHLWASKHALASWESKTPKLLEIRVSEEVEFLLKVHPKLVRPMSGTQIQDSVWGIPIRVDYSLPSDPGYTIVYMRGE